MKEVDFGKRLNRWVSESVTLKILLIGFLTLIMVVPANMISGLVHERKTRRDAATQEIGSKWGRQQTITGPVLNIPVKTNCETDKHGKTHCLQQNAHFLPDNIDIEGDLQTQMRYRGIYEAVLYTSTIKMSGSFSSPRFDDLKTHIHEILWEKAFVSVGVSDMRGINESVLLSWDKQEFRLSPGIGSTDIVDSGLSTRVPLSSSPRSNSLVFSMSLDLNGSHGIYFAPLGGETRATISSPWVDPSFQGAFLPDQRTVSKDGFRASWKVLDLNRPYPQQWVGSQYSVEHSNFGVNLFVPNDAYQKSTRSLKYASLFIVLTFALLFFLEVLNGKRFHLIQYCFVGFSICMFYLLLLSISEHTGFPLAYAVASAAIIFLITGYVRAVVKNTGVTALVGSLITILYAVLYLLLQLTDHALLIGSVGLFGILALLMYLSRRVNWYAVRVIAPDTASA